MKANQTVAELMEIRSQIDHTLQQRLSQTLCLLLADVVGSTRFFQQHGDVQGRFFVQRHHDTVIPLITGHGGKVIKTIGDAVMASFEALESGLDCALEIQHKLYEARSQNDKEEMPQSKISLHYGPGLVETSDIYGDLVNVSARINGMAKPDQILISHTVYERVKGRQELPMLPLSTSGWKAGEKSLPVYEVLWQQHAEATGKPLAQRFFEGGYCACFYCGLSEHPARQCPSKQLSHPAHRLAQLGYQPLPDILALFQQANLNGEETTDTKVFEAFYELSLPYQVRFLPKIWLATGTEDWSSLQRQPPLAAHALVGTRLWSGVDCLRVGRYEPAREYFRSTVQSNPGDYKPHVGLGFLDLEQDNPTAALQHWRKALMLTKTSLQAAYVHLLIHRLYEVNGKTPLAYQELQKALDKDRYLYEARYRQLALMGKETGGEELVRRLRKLIQEDRGVYVKVLLDPAFARVQEPVHALLQALYQEARTEALACLPRVTEEFNALHAWYPQPEGEFLAIERTLERLRQHIKTDSYFGYDDALHEGTTLQASIQRVSERRKTTLQHDYTTALTVLEERLAALARQPQLSGRVEPLLRDCTRLQSMTSFDTAAAFWQAWGELQQLRVTAQELESP